VAEIIEIDLLRESRAVRANKEHPERYHVPCNAGTRLSINHLSPPAKQALKPKKKKKGD